MSCILLKKQNNTGFIHMFLAISGMIGYYSEATQFWRYLNEQQ